jgi:hypothetical protein
MIPIPILYLKYISIRTNSSTVQICIPSAQSGMTITFETDSDVIVQALEKRISFAKENQYLFVANCAWWLAGIIGLDSGLTTFINNLEIWNRVRQPREISMIPRDIARSESVGSDKRNLEESLVQINHKIPSPTATRATRSNPTGGIQKLTRKQRKRISKAKRA